MGQKSKRAIPGLTGWGKKEALAGDRLPYQSLIDENVVLLDEAVIKDRVLPELAARYFPDGYKVMPHWHPNFERVTIIKGTLHLGMGESFDKNSATALTAGSYSFMPPGMRHFAWVRSPSRLSHISAKTALEQAAPGSAVMFNELRSAADWLRQQP